MPSSSAFLAVQARPAPDRHDHRASARDVREERVDAQSAVAHHHPSSVNVVDRGSWTSLHLGAQDQERDVGSTLRTGSLALLDERGAASGKVHRLHTGKALGHRSALQRECLLREGWKGLPQRLEERGEFGVERRSGGGIGEVLHIGRFGHWPSSLRVACAPGPFVGRRTTTVLRERPSGDWASANSLHDSWRKSESQQGAHRLASECPLRSSSYSLMCSRLAAFRDGEPRSMTRRSLD